MFMDGKTALLRYLPNLACRFNTIAVKNPRKLFCGYLQTSSKVYTEREKTQGSLIGGGKGGCGREWRRKRWRRTAAFCCLITQ